METAFALFRKAELKKKKKMHKQQNILGKSF